MNRKSMVTVLAVATVAGIVGVGGPATASATLTAGKPLFVISNKTYLGEVCKTQPGNKLRGISGTGPITLRLNVQNSVSATWSGNAGITAGGVSAEMGFDVTRSYAVSEIATYEVPSGRRGHLEGYPCFARYSFKYQLATGGGGKGFADKPVGVYFKKWQTKK